MSLPVHLGLDVGGTASRWVACGPDGAVLARGKVAGATGHVFNPVEQDRLRAVLQSVAGALADAGLVVGSVTAGMTGYGSVVADAAKALVQDSFAGAGDIVLMDDIFLAYLAQFEPGEGHLVSAGTGSIGVHIGRDGAMVRVGGRGILIDDAGSGSWIALQALDRLYRLLDRQGSFAGAERLAEQLFALMGGSGWHDVRQFIYGGDRGRIGTLAVAVARAAQDDDAMALGILREAGQELAQLGLALLARAGDRPLRFIGGVLELHPVIFEEALHTLDGRNAVKTTGDAALAAAQLQTGHRKTWTTLLAGPLSA